MCTHNQWCHTAVWPQGEPKPMRKQNDGLGDYYSEATALDCSAPRPDGSENKDMTRQEFAAEADINTLLSRYGIGVPRKQVMYGEVDFGMDLQQAFAAIEAAKRMHRQLPDTLIEKYPSWEKLLNGLASGQLRLDLEADTTAPGGSEIDGVGLTGTAAE